MPYGRNLSKKTRSPAVAEKADRTEYDALINDHLMIARSLNDNNTSPIS